MKRIAAVVFLMTLALVWASTAGDGRVVISLTADQVYRTALAVKDVWWQPGEPGIHLARRIVVETDSPGCGRRDSDAGVTEEISGATVLRKEFELSTPVPKGVQLAFVGRERTDNNANLEILVNGNIVVRRPTRLSAPDAKQYLVPDPATNRVWSWTRWHYQEIPAGHLRPGKNQVLLRSRDGSPGWAIVIADYADFYKGCSGTPIFPKTSAKSQDGGKTWQQDNLGSKNQISGEYVLRMILDSYRPHGSIESRIIDAAGENGATFKTPSTARGVRIKPEAQGAAGLLTEVRSGDTPVYDAGHWSAWARPAPDGSVATLRGRYLQWRIALSTSDPETSPEVKGVTVEADVTTAAAAGRKVKVIREDNFEILPAPEGYVYEDFQGAYLKRFREHFQLDAIVAGAHTEWERQQRLMAWAYRAPLKDPPSIYPWDPLNWVDDRRGADGKLIMNTYKQWRRDKMCLFSNVLLVAAFQSFGYPARHVNLHSEGLSGHEIAEVWSNQFGKWVHMDATQNCYWYEKKTGWPVNTLEIHKALVKRLVEIETWRRPFYYAQRPETYLNDIPIAATENEPYGVQKDLYWIFTTSAHLRMVPRGDVFSRSSPVPISQGQEVWCWNGYLDWADSKVPALEQFSHHTNREQDFNWPVNQVRYVVEQTTTPGLLTISLEHNMPNLQALLARFDGETWKKVEARFPVKLHQGRNTLEFQGQNTAGVEGMRSTLVVDCEP